MHGVRKNDDACTYSLCRVSARHGNTMIGASLLLIGEDETSAVEILPNRQIRIGIEAAKRSKIMHITLKQLKRLGACETELLRFRAYFGDSVALTRDVCVGHARDFSFSWAAAHLLSASGCAAYQEKRDTIDAAYREQMNPIDAARREQLATLDAAYQEQRDTIDAAHREQLGPINAARREQMASLFFDLYARCS